MLDTTFCIQGPLLSPEGVPQARVLYESIRTHFPSSKIIVSTWEEDKPNRFSGPDFIFSPDPGSGLVRIGKTNNINRQITSSRAALMAVDTTWAAKLRSDLVITSSNLNRFVDILDNSIPKQTNLSGLEGRLLVLDRHTYSPKKNSPVAIPLHVSDHFQFGKTRDMQKLWDIELIKRSDEDFRLEEATQTGDSSIHIPKFRAEQYFWIQSMKKSLGEKSWMVQWTGKESDLPFRTEDWMSDNIVPAKSSTLGIRSQKHSFTISKDLINSTFAYTFLDWERSASFGAMNKIPRRYILWEISGELYRHLVRIFRFVFKRKEDPPS